MTKKKQVPKLKKKDRHELPADSLAATLNWDVVADPGDGWNAPVRKIRRPKLSK